MIAGKYRMAWVRSSDDVRCDDVDHPTRHDVTGGWFELNAGGHHLLE